MLNPQYIPATFLQQYFVDKDTGAALSGGILSFYEDDDREESKPVYQLTGAPPNYTYTILPNPLTLGADGVPLDAGKNQTVIYFYPYDSDGNVQLYYVTLTNALGTFQQSFEAVPNVTSETNPETPTGSIENMISNSQFVDVLFEPSLGQTITFTGAQTLSVYPVAPGWDLVLSSTGSGTVTLGRLSIEGSLGIETNPPYILTVLPSGSTISKLYLRQRLYHNPDIFSSTTDVPSYLAGTLLIGSLDGLPHTLNMQYTQSNGSNTQTIVSGTTLSSGYLLASNTVLMNTGTNTDTSDEGYVDIIINLPTVGYVGISSIQITGLYSDQDEVHYEQEPVNRQIDHLFHYYNDLLQFKPISSFLTGWDFPLNPAQYGTSNAFGSSGANGSVYVWDQTIGFQSVNSSMSASRGTTGALVLTASATTQTAIIQYLTTPEMYEIFNNDLSVNINFASVSVPDDTVCTISLWYSTSTMPLITSNLSIVASLNSDGYPSTFNGTWTEITRGNLGNAQFDLTNTVANATYDVSFNGWSVVDKADAYNNANYFAIVVGFSSITSGSTIGFQSVSLVPGQIATRPAPQTRVQVLQDCQRYLEMSYSEGSVPGTVTTLGSITQNFTYGTASALSLLFYEFEVLFKIPKIVAPTVVLYSPISATSNHISAQIQTVTGAFPTPTTAPSNPYSQVVNGAFNVSEVSTNNITYVAVASGTIMGTTGSSDTAAAQYQYHYVADSRLGTF